MVRTRSRGTAARKPIPFPTPPEGREPEPDEELEDCRDPAWAFPLGEHWKITEENAESWRGHQFSALFSDPRLVEPMGPLEEDELFLLRLDLLWYEAAVERAAAGRGRHPGPAAEYLQPGREHWGLGET